MSASQLIADRFEISDLEKDLLGRGGMGDVYRATDTQTGEPVAVKALKSGVVVRDPDILERFVREGEALRQLNHPNIVGMVAAVEEAGQHYLIMEYVGGGSLQDLLAAQGPLPSARSLEIALDLADALTRAHRLDIIHRDLKPANVLLAEDGTPRLTDFGIAHVADSPRLTQTGVLVGTVDYLSPEACNGETLDARADIWAFGVLLYEMLTGERPFRGKTLSATLMAILTQPIPDLAQLCPDVPDALVDLIYRMLEKDRQQRVPSVRLVGAELEAILKGREVPTPARLAPAESRFATPTPPADAPRHNLPAQPTPFVGREAELTELARLLADPSVHLVTVLGAGGMGKTRLALEAAAAEINNFEHGVYFVSLAPLDSVEAIVPTVAEALGFSFYEGGEPQQQLLDYVHQKAMLLLMDNFEHLLDGVGLVADVLKTAPEVKTLATSRARLNVQGEHLFHLAGMDFPDWETSEDAAQYSAVKLFLQSARRARPGFELEADDLKHVAHICRLVQGMPLGILLAAAWLEMLTPGEIATEIGQGLDFLETDLRDVPERQRSMRAVFDHSWRLLTEREREVFQGLSVFRGGFARQAAQQVTGASLRELMALVDKSLLHRTPTGRYQVHELTRQYAAEKLELSPAANEAARDRHCAYYTAALQRWEADLKGPQQVAALAEMDVEIENARGAWNWAAEQGQVGRLDRAIFGLCQYYTLRGRLQECGAACEAAAQRLEGMMSGDTPVLSKAEGLRVLARVLKWQGDSMFSLGRYEAGQQLVQQSLTLLDDPALAGQDTRAERASILGAMSGMVFYTEGVQTRQWIEERLALYQELGDRWGVAQVLGVLASRAFWRGDLDEAKRQSEEFLALCQELGDQQGIGDAYSDLGNVARARGELDKAEHLCRKAIKILREIQQPHSLRWAQWYLSLTFMLAGKFAQARALMEESLASFGYLGEKCVADSHAVLGFVEMSLGDYERARVQGETSLALARRTRNRWSIALSLFVLGCVALVEGESGLDAGAASHMQNADEAREAYAEAQRLSQESVAIYREMDSRLWLGIPLAVLGVAARALGDIDQAQRHLYEALRIAGDIGAFWPLMLAVPATALVLADVGEHERAVELYALASRYPFVGKSRWFEDVFGHHIAAASLPPEVVAAAQKRGWARDLEATVAELLAELGGRR